MQRSARFAQGAFPAVVIAGLLAGAACVTDKVTGEKKFAVLQWSNEEEQKIGDESAPNFEQQFGGAFPDQTDQQYLGSVVKEMASHSVRKDDFDYKFEILNSSEPNAFALPGGYVYITRGLLEHLESEGEFVGVLGHELGHVEHQHSMLQQNKTLLATGALAVLGIGENLLQKDPEQPDTVTALASYGAPLALLHFSREQESEADERGIFFAHEMGYDPREMKKTFVYFQQLEAKSGGQTPSFLRDHPTNEKRLADIDDLIRDKYPDVLQKSPTAFRAPPGSGDRFVQIVASMKSAAPAYKKQEQALALLAQGSDPRKLQQAAKLADEAHQALPDEPLIECLMGEVQFAQKGGDRGRAHFERSRSLQQKAVPGKEYWKPAFYLGAIAENAGNHAAAVPQLKRATALFPDNPIGHYYLGSALEKTGDARGAANAFHRAAQLAPADSALQQKSLARVQSLQGGATTRNR